MLRIHYFTGTGNSWWAAQQLSALAQNNGLETELSAAAGRKKGSEKAPERNDLVVFSYPTHGFSLPWHMLKFIMAYPRGRARVVLVNNRAGMKFGRIFTPGLSGIAILLPMLILCLKGYRIAGALPLDTPSNWVVIHPGLSLRTVHAIMERRKREIHKLWQKMAAGKCSFPTKFWIMIPLDILVTPVSLAYLAFGRFLLTATYTADPSCDGCGLCASQCPVGAIRMVGKKPHWSIRCESCMRCLNICPEKAAHGSWLLMGLFTWALIRLTSFSGPLAFAWKALNRWGGEAASLPLYPAWWLLTVFMAWMLGHLVFYLNRWKPAARFLAVTTPMHFWRRYLHPAFGPARNSRES